MSAAILLVQLSACAQNGDFKLLDANGDGFVTAEEVPAEKRVRVEELLAVAGKSDNGKLSPTEYRAADEFDQLNVNDDEFITLGEVAEEQKEQVDQLLATLRMSKDSQIDFQNYLAGTTSQGLPWYLVVLILSCATIASFLVSGYTAKALRMPDYGWKIGLILTTVSCGALYTWLAWPPKLAIDLNGGVNLVYEVDLEKTEGQFNVNELVRALVRRINPGGVKEVVIRPFGVSQVEIIIPEVESSQVEQIKQIITKSGFLEFLIVANKSDHQRLINLAQQQQAAATAEQQIARVVKDDDGEVIGRWVKVDSTEVDTLGDTTRETELGETEILMHVDEPSRQVTGDDLGVVSAGIDDNTLSPCVNFQMRGSGIGRFEFLTSDNLPDVDANIYRRLGIVLDDELLSAPRIQSIISDRGQITGRFDQQEVDILVGVLKAGRLPATLRPEPISEHMISALLGADTVFKGSVSIAASLLVVLLFMAVYYRFAGLVACASMLAALLFVLTLMLLVNGAFSLPGLAGLVLIVGISVDSNVLIFERIREELRRGAALRMAIRNGFERATTTIIDANVTTLITAVVLYGMGADQLRGFAVVIILGILMSMYTSIFCARVAFDIGERRGWISELRMMHVLGETKFDFIGKRKLAAVCSMALIVIGLVGTVIRGKQLFDIDFNGGTSVHVLFEQDQPMPIAEVRQRVSEIPDVTVSEVKVETEEPNLQFKLETSLGSDSSIDEQFTLRDQDGDDQLSEQEYVGDDREGRVAEYAKMRFRDLDGDENQLISRSEFTITTQDVQRYWLDAIFGDQLRRYELQHTSPVELAGADEAAADSESDQPGDDDEARLDLPPDSTLALAGGGALAQDDSEQPSSAAPAGDSEAEDADAEDASKETDDVGEAEDTDPSEETADENPTSQAEPTTDEADRQPAPSPLKTQVELVFSGPISRSELADRLGQAAEDLTLELGTIRLERREPEAGVGDKWDLKLSRGVEQTGQILDKLQSRLAEEPIFPASSSIGGRVVGKMRDQAVLALLASLVCIVGYVGFRFHQAVFGLAAVVALVHDVMVTLGALALSLWLAKVFGFLLIDEFKIGLTVVAAFLTIIGYSLNDTIVVFDRIREIRGKSPELTEAMINKSINQTLGRTVLTSMTTLIVVLILYIFGGQGIHAFAFALLVGVLVGTYSSIFVASPCLLWMTRSGKPSTPAKREAEASA